MDGEFSQDFRGKALRTSTDELELWANGQEFGSYE